MWERKKNVFVMISEKSKTTRIKEIRTLIASTYFTERKLDLTFVYKLVLLFVCVTILIFTLHNCF